MSEELTPDIIAQMKDLGIEVPESDPCYDENRLEDVKDEVKRLEDLVRQLQEDEPTIDPPWGTTPTGRSFREGNKVRVRMVYDPLVPDEIDAIYISGPQGQGDTIKLEVDGQPVEINGNASTFEGIWPRPGDKPEDPNDD